MFFKLDSNFSLKYIYTLHQHFLRQQLFLARINLKKAKPVPEKEKNK